MLQIRHQWIDHWWNIEKCILHDNGMNLEQQSHHPLYYDYNWYAFSNLFRVSLSECNCNSTPKRSTKYHDSVWIYIFSLSQYMECCLQSNMTCIALVITSSKIGQYLCIFDKTFFIWNPSTHAISMYFRKMMNWQIREHFLVYYHNAPSIINQKEIAAKAIVHLNGIG